MSGSPGLRTVIFSYVRSRTLDSSIREGKSYAHRAQLTEADVRPSCSVPRSQRSYVFIYRSVFAIQCRAQHDYHAAVARPTTTMPSVEHLLPTDPCSQASIHAFVIGWWRPRSLLSRAHGAARASAEAEGSAGQSGIKAQTATRCCRRSRTLDPGCSRRCREGEACHLFQRRDCRRRVVLRLVRRSRRHPAEPLQRRPMCVFHDAIAISPALESQGKFGGGGADGSIILFDDIETNFHPNIGLDEIVNLQKPFIQKHGVTPGDFIAFAGAVAMSNCPGAPQMNFFTGRAPATQAAPDGLVPEPFHTVDQIISRVNDAGEFDELELVWMLSAHSVAAANDVDPTIQGLPFDSTPGVFDSQFFVETQLRGTAFPGSGGNQGEVESPLPGEMRLQSDSSIARDSRTACEWQSFVNNQSKLVSDFQFIFLALTQLGQNPDAMTDCSDVIPISKPVPNNVPFSFFPAGKTMADVEQACAETPFPTLTTLPGPETSVQRIQPPPGA